jgi:molecular chaperone DnaJ/curved DNA-binding protein
MADDYYQTLGLKKDAAPEAIQKAYRDLARKYHPDMNPDDKTAKEKFQKVQAAFEVLNDPDKRAKYDRFGSAYDSAGSGGPRGAPFTWTSGGETGANFQDVDLSDLFGGGGGGFADILKGFGRGGGRSAGPARNPRPPRRGSDLTYELQVPFNTAVLGGEAAISVQRADGHLETINVKIPPGIEDGKKIRLRGQGESVGRGGEPGDILITVRVAAHPHFQRRGKNLDVQVPISLAEAALGAKIDVPTPRGTIALSIPPGTSSGKRLRIKGHGVESSDGVAGDLYAETLIVLPEDLDVEDLNAIKKIIQKHPYNPRADLRW